MLRLKPTNIFDFFATSSFRFSAAQSEIFFSAIFNRDESHKIKAIKNRNKFVSNCKFETTVEVFWVVISATIDYNSLMC